ncbi:MAG: transcriptional repressor, partial [Gaiellaceae bacterium]
MRERRTRQLTAVADVVNAAHDHPSAEEVHRRVRRKLPRVSLGTVYRNLQKLSAQQ